MIMHNDNHIIYDNMIIIMIPAYTYTLDKYTYSNN